MNTLDNVSNIYWVNNILPNIPHRLFGFEQDPVEKIHFEGYSTDGFPIITSFYGDLDKPKFVVLIKLTLNEIPNTSLNEFVTKNDIKDIENIKYKYSPLPISQQIVIYKVDADLQIIDQIHKNI